jgi:hypothetical protein
MSRPWPKMAHTVSKLDYRSYPCYLILHILEVAVEIKMPQYLQLGRLP